MNESNRLRASLVLCCLVIGVHSGFAQWNLVQNASSINANCVQLTSASPTQRGAAWHDCQIHLDAGFDLEFTVNLGNDEWGADGMCFILQQAGNIGNNLVGASGGSIGYSDGPFTPSLAVEIDTWQNGGTGDPVYDHIGICRDGENNHNVAPPVQANVNNANIETGLSYPFRVTWDPATTLLEVFFNGELRHSVNVDLIGDVFGNNPLVYWGWTGTTGGATNIHSFCLTEALYFSIVDSVSLEATELCDCLSPALDVIGVCGGDCPADFNQNGICDDEEIPGCMYEESVNFNPAATMDDGSCMDPNGCESACSLIYEGDNDGVVGTDDLLGLLTEFGASCN